MDLSLEHSAFAATAGRGGPRRGAGAARGLPARKVPRRRSRRRRADHAAVLFA